MTMHEGGRPETDPNLILKFSEQAEEGNSGGGLPAQTPPVKLIKVEGRAPEVFISFSLPLKKALPVQ